MKKLSDKHVLLYVKEPYSKEEVVVEVKYTVVEEEEVVVL